MIGFIYAVECGGRIKVGFSESPEKRFNKIASDAPFPCEMLGYWRGSKADELEIHKKFQETRVHGEWFASTEAILSFIAAVSEPRSRESVCKRYIPNAEDSPLLAWRKKQKVPGGVIAEKLGTTRATLSRWELGRLRIPANRVLDIERLTGIPRHDLRPDVFGKSPENAA